MADGSSFEPLKPPPPPVEPPKRRGPDLPERKPPRRFGQVSWVEEGMNVWIRWTREPYVLLRCKVSCAAGNHARIENKEHGVVERWFRTDDLLVPEGDPHGYEGPV
jgi:hypothetical protein